MLRLRVPGGSALIAVVAATVALALTIDPAATAAGHRFPVPKCSWVPASLVSRTFGVPVRAGRPVWRTNVAPELICPFSEKNHRLQVAGEPIALVAFHELVRFKTKGFRFVRHLGSCVVHSSCPEPHKPAWIRTVTGQVGSYPYGFHASPQRPYGFSYIAGVELRVEDGLNYLQILVVNPFGALPVKGEVGQVEKLARKLLPLFRWK